MAKPRDEAQAARHRTIEGPRQQGCGRVGPQGEGTVDEARRARIDDVVLNYWMGCRRSTVPLFALHGINEVDPRGGVSHGVIQDPFGRLWRRRADPRLSSGVVGVTVEAVAPTPDQRHHVSFA